MLPEIDDLAMIQQQGIADPGINGHGDINNDTDNPEAPVEQEEELPEEIRTAILALYENTRQEDESIRTQQLQKLRSLNLFWEGFQSLFWDYSAKDWRTLNDLPDNENFDPDLDKILNIYRAHGESIIAALSINTPGTSFFPDDADNPDDVYTAKGFDAIVNLIQKHTDAKLLLIHCLQILWNQGTIAAYNYLRNDPKFGTIPVPNYKSRQVPYHDIYCESCGYKMATVKETMPTEPIQCPECGYNAVPQVITNTETIQELVDYSNEPKGRVEIELFGPLNFKIPYYAKRQADCGYLHLNIDKHYGMVRELFRSESDEQSQLFKQIVGGPGKDTYERYMRLPSRYLGSIPQDLSAVNCVWFRPWMYNTLNDEIAAQLRTSYPNGLYALIINGDIVAEVKDESLDDHWTLSIDPLSEYIHGEPLGKPIQDVQVMTNDLANLTLQTIEYGIPETFADPHVLDFDKYGKSQAAPGMVTPTKPSPGKSLAEGFYTVKTASLSQEVKMFGDQLEQMGQFLVGDFPSVYGGPAEGSKTATEYQQSGARALQRLSLVWTKLTVFWSKLMSKSATEFFEQMKGDEKYVKKSNGRFLNVWIKKSLMTGKIGHVEPESSEQLPQSWMQKRDQIMKLMTMANPNIDAVLYAPENSEVMKQAFAMPELYIPGEEDRLKQLEEIYDMMNVDVDGQIIFDGMNPTVPIDPELDDHMVHMKVMKNYMLSMQGLEIRKENPIVYENWLAHYRQHMMAMPPASMPSDSNQPSGGEQNVTQES